MNQPLILNTLSTILNSEFRTGFIRNDLQQQINKTIGITDAQSLLMKEQKFKELVICLNESLSN